MPPPKKRGPRGHAATSKRSATFEEYYGGVYGARWPVLRKALAAAAPRKVALWNRFCQLPFEKALPNVMRVDDASLLQLFRGNDDAVELPPPLTDEFNVKAYHSLEYTAALVVEQLEVNAFDHVLDLCAALGGKSIAIAQFLSPDAMLTSNEQRGDRCARLRRSLREYVPTNYVPVTVTQREAATWHAPSTYHRVLVDAPCSAERHLLQQCGTSPVSTRDWTQQTTVEMNCVQRALLLRAIETCRPGGRVVYSTCSISPLENDGVVEDVLQRTRCQVEVRSPSLRIGEKTRYGHLVLPDTADGYGPMFCCVIHKVSDRREDSDDDDDDDDTDASEEGMA